MKIFFTIISIAVMLLIAISLFAPKNSSFLSVEKLETKPDVECPDPEYRDEAHFKRLLEKMKQQTYKDKMLEFLRENVPLDARVFTSTQLIELFEAVTFSDAKAEVMSICNPFVQFFTPDEIILLLKNVVYSSSKLELLEVIANTLEDNSEENKKEIVEGAFDYSSDKTKAKKILDDANARNCIYGDVKEKVATFVVDISPSMKWTFKTVSGKTMSRIDFVKSMLTTTLSEQLKPYQNFNIIAFGGSSKSWQSDCVPATEDNIQAAVKWVNALGEISATNISGALEKAFSSKDKLLAIYFLTDGFPNSGITDKEEMRKWVIQKNEEKKSQSLPEVKINVVGMQLGGQESPEEKKKARDFMVVLAEASQGTFRDFEHE